MRNLLDFDDAGADDDHPVKGVTVGDIRAWHDYVERLLAALRDPDFLRDRIALLLDRRAECVVCDPGEKCRGLCTNPYMTWGEYLSRLEKQILDKDGGLKMATQKQALAFEDAVIDLIAEHVADGLDADTIKRALEYQARNVHELAGGKPETPKQTMPRTGDWRLP